MAAGDDPTRPRLTFTRVKIPVHSIQYSAFTAVLFLILLDVSFVENLQTLLTRGVHDGYRLLYKLLTCLKLAVCKDEAAAARVVGHFVDALLMCHWFHKDEIVTTAACWELLTRMAPDAMDHYKVRCRLTWECPKQYHFEYGVVDYVSRVVVVPRDSEWVDGGLPGEHTGYWRTPVRNNDEFEYCPRYKRRGMGRRTQCRTRPDYRMLHILSPSTQNFVMRFTGGMEQDMWDSVTSGGCIWFSGQCWAIWGGNFEMASGRTLCCYLINKANGRRWVRLNTNTGAMDKNQGILSRDRCVEVLCQSPEVNCWCGQYSDWSMWTCGVCQRQGHYDCIMPESNKPDKTGRTWDGAGCGHCEAAARANRNS